MVVAEGVGQRVQGDLCGREGAGGGRGEQLGLVPEMLGSLAPLVESLGGGIEDDRTEAVPASSVRGLQTGGQRTEAVADRPVVDAVPDRAEEGHRFIDNGVVGVHPGGRLPGSLRQARPHAQQAVVDPIRAAPGHQRVEGPEEGVGLADGSEGAAGVPDRHVGPAVLVPELGPDQAEQGPDALAPLADAVDDLPQVVVTLAAELRQRLVDLRGRDPADAVADGLVAFEREGQAQMLAGIVSGRQPPARNRGSDDIELVGGG